MSSRFVRSVYLCALALAVIASSAIPLHAADATVKVGFWNVRSGKGVTALPGHAAPFVDSTNCTDPSQPLNAWGTGAMQVELAKALSDPSVIALGVAESWGNVCASPQNIKLALGWKANTGEQNGVALVARYGVVGDVEWKQLDTSLNKLPADTAWVLKATVCVNEACSVTMPVYVGHWYGSGTNERTTYNRQAEQTATFLGATAGTGPHVFVGDLNVYEGTATTCAAAPNNESLGFLREGAFES